MIQDYIISIQSEDLSRFIGGEYLFSHHEAGHRTYTRGTIVDIKIADENNGHSIDFKINQLSSHGVNQSFYAEVADQVSLLAKLSPEEITTEKIFVPKERVGGNWEVEPFRANSETIAFRNSNQGDRIEIQQNQAPLTSQREWNEAHLPDASFRS